MRLKNKKINWPELPVIFNAVTYRLPLPVEEVVVLKLGECYPRCPRCGESIDREYMCYCDRCGQKLGWRGFSYGKICEVVLK